MLLSQADRVIDAFWSVRIISCTRPVDTGLTGLIKLMIPLVFIRSPSSIKLTSPSTATGKTQFYVEKAGFLYQYSKGFPILDFDFV